MYVLYLKTRGLLLVTISKIFSPKIYVDNYAKNQKKHYIVFFPENHQCFFDLKRSHRLKYVVITALLPGAMTMENRVTRYVY
jgi:hypothetical protein